MRIVGRNFTGPVSSEDNYVSEPEMKIEGNFTGPDGSGCEPEIKIEWEYDAVIFGNYDGAPVLGNMNGKSGVKLFA